MFSTLIFREVCAYVQTKLVVMITIEVDHLFLTFENIVLSNIQFILLTC